MSWEAESRVIHIHILLSRSKSDSVLAFVETKKKKKKAKCPLMQTRSFLKSRQPDGYAALLGNKSLVFICIFCTLWDHAHFTGIWFSHVLGGYVVYSPTCIFWELTQMSTDFMTRFSCDKIGTLLEQIHLHFPCIITLFWFSPLQSPGFLPFFPWWLVFPGKGISIAVFSIALKAFVEE